MTEQIKDLKVTLEDVEPCVKKISIEVPLDAVANEKESAYAELRKQSNVPGFRKGNAPKKIIEKMYGERVHGDVAQRLIGSAYKNALEENDIHPVGEPLIDEVVMDADRPLTFSATVEIFPEITVGDISDISIQKNVVKVDEKEIDNVIEQGRERHARFETVEGRTAQKGDYVIIDYSAAQDGVDIEQFKGESRQVFLDPEHMFEGFFEGVEGIGKGEEREFEVNLPDDFPEKEMAGKLVTFKVRLGEIKEKILPDIDDDLAKEISDFDTIDEYKTDLRKGFESRARESAKNSLKEELLDRLIGKSDISLPPMLLDRQTKSFASASDQMLAGQGLGPDSDGYDASVIAERARESAVRTLKEQVIITSYAKENNIEVDDKKVDAEFARIAGIMGTTIPEVKELMAKNGNVAGIINQVFSDSVYEHMLGKIKIEENKNGE